MFDRFPALSTARLQLREVTLQDMDAAAELYGGPAMMKTCQGNEKNLDIPAPQENRAVRPPEREAIAYRIQEWFITPYQEQRGIRFGIYLNHSNRLIGSCGFCQWNRAHYKAELVFELHPEYRKRGLLKEALTALIDFGFDAMELNRIEARIEDGNQAAQRTLLSLGFRQEGVEREAEFDGAEFIDIVCLSLLKSDGPPPVHLVK
ncbi:GNAT family N-acetyltransferase [Paenibacillus ihumii]|uniref:GNAT family N-acetyltransferase n=1 Tax=Paenibacillus ihumii TaxID=687436 RepID=UPI0006D76646|nr:GNAT family protein [Paenibacillus ihumii]